MTLENFISISAGIILIFILSFFLIYDVHGQIASGTPTPQFIYTPPIYSKNDLLNIITEKDLLISKYARLYDTCRNK